MGYTIPEWCKSQESIHKHMLKLWLAYMETYEKKFIDKINKNKRK